MMAPLQRRPINSLARWKFAQSCGTCLASLMASSVYRYSVTRCFLTSSHFFLYSNRHRRAARGSAAEEDGHMEGLILVRLVVGPLMALHGAQKLFGWLGGYGLDGTGGFFEQLGF